MLHDFFYPTFVVNTALYDGGTSSPWNLIHQNAKICRTSLCLFNSSVFFNIINNAKGGTIHV